MLESHNKGTLLRIRVKPRSKKQAILLEGESVCSVYVKAAPTRSQANIEVIKLIANKLRIPRHCIRIISGEKKSTKILLIEGMDSQSVLAALR